MEKDNKNSWKCKNCITKPKPLYENITVRNNYKSSISKENSYEALSSLSSKDNDDVNDGDVDTKQQCFIPTNEHNRSCPEKTMIYDRAEKMEIQILELQEKLQIMK